jgi:molybdenum ABC transporter, periplasmic molybdate-binding protein
MSKLTIYSAGSFRYALLEITGVFKQCNEVEIECIFGPAGLLKTRLIQGELADLFISANSENVSALGNQVFQQRTLTYNRLMLTTKNKPEFQRDTLDLLFDSKYRLTISTPICDPCGDYTWQLFDLIEKDYPEQGKRLKSKALKLVGGTENQVVIPPGEMTSHYLLKNDYADMMLGYAHYQTRLENAGMLCHTLPSEYDIRAEYVLAMLNDTELTQRFYQFLLDETAQEIIRKNGFKND